MNRARHISFSRPRGGMSVTMMLVMIALLAMLGLIEIGFLFWAKRDAQKVVDLAALAGAQRLDLCNASNADNSAARQSALSQNRFRGQVQIQCGNWNATRGTADHFSPSVDASNPRNAVRVVAERGVLPFFGQNRTLPTLRVHAVAKRSEPTANLALWALLRGDTATVERLAQQASFSEQTRRSVEQQAQQIRARLQQRQAAATAAAAAATRPVASATPSPSATGPRLAAEPRRDGRDQREPPRLPPSMLERFGTTDHPTGNTP